MTAARREEVVVVLDTSVLHNTTQHRLLSRSAEEFIKKHRSHQDLSISWYLPEVVVLERHSQMWEKVESTLRETATLLQVLGFNFPLDAETVRNRIMQVIDEQMRDQGLEMLATDFSKVDWRLMMLRSVYRQPPFEAGDKEKGFRDALVVEAFLQRALDLRSNPHIGHVCLVSQDKRMREAVESRSASLEKVRILPEFEALSSLINVLASDADEAFVSSIQEVAAKTFFLSGDESTLYYRGQLIDRIKQEFGSALEQKPSYATRRDNRAWVVHGPVFLRKQGQRVSWVSRVVVTAEARGHIVMPRSVVGPPEALRSLGFGDQGDNTTITFDDDGSWTLADPDPILMGKEYLRRLSEAGEALPPRIRVERTEVTAAMGETVFEVEWSATVAPDKSFHDQTVHGIRLVGTEWL